MLAFKSSLLATIVAVLALVSGAYAESGPIDVAGWEELFAFQYDYVLAETAGLDREFEPVEVTLSVPGPAPQRWQDHIRVVRLESSDRGRLVPHQSLGKASAVAKAVGEARVPAPAESVNVVFLAHCPAFTEVTYRLFWGLPENAPVTDIHLPVAEERSGLQVTGEPPGLAISNEYYVVHLDPKSGAIKTARRAGHGEDSEMFYRAVPIHFGTDVWSPPQGWDHDYDWVAPPNQKQDGGAVALRYRRWGPMQNYRDVIASITYTFYAHVPYVHVSSTMEFTKDRSVHAVRMGEIVVSHSRTPSPAQADVDAENPEIFSHFAWPNEDGTVFTRQINAHRDADGRANIEGVAAGALGILDRDVPWVAGYHAEKGYGMASLRKAQFAGNRLGGPIPQSAPCTYVANYGWGFSYWSRPMVYPLGMKDTPLDQNVAIAAGAIFAIEEALLIFEPDTSLRQVREVHRQFTKPLRFEFKGTGPW